MGGQANFSGSGGTSRSLTSGNPAFQNLRLKVFYQAERREADTVHVPNFTC